MPTASRPGDGRRDRPGRPADPRRHATSASGLVHEATAQLLAALEHAVAAAAARSINDTGARKSAAALRDARLALDLAITAAGHTLAAREVPVGELHPPDEAG